MQNAVRGGYRIRIRPAPDAPARYLWTIHGTRCLFHEESAASYASIEQALSEANAWLDRLL